MPFSFNRDHIKMMIEEYKKYPELYDRLHAQYNDNSRRYDCWVEITQNLISAFDISPTIYDVKHKIRMLRTQIAHEIEKEAKLKARNIHYRPSWCYYNDMIFLVNGGHMGKKGNANDSTLKQLYEQCSSETATESDMGFQDDNSRLSFYDPLEVDSKPDHVHIEVLNVENGPSTTSYADSRFQFNHEHTEMMIELYKSHPELYDPFDPLYHHRKRKLECWQEIAYKVSVRFNISPSAEDVKQKFRSLRTQYTCELKKERMNNGKGLNGRTFKSNWWCFNLLSFLSEINTRQEKIVSRFGLSSTVSEQNRAMDAAESSGVMSAESHAEDVLDINDVDFSCTPSLQESSDELEYHDDQSRDPTSTKKPQNTDSPDDDIRVFAQYVEAELRKIKVTKITKLKRNIINLIYDALDEDEDEN